jgi:hypothetical protein
MKKNITWIMAAGVVVLAAAGFSATRQTGARATADAAPTAEVVARGNYLVNTMGCHDCHTPWTVGPNGPEPDMTRALTGHPEQIGKMTPAEVPDYQPPTEDGPQASN